MAAGKTASVSASPVVRALRLARKLTRAEIQVHISHRRREKDVVAKAQKIFDLFEMSRSEDRSGVLIYVNLRAKTFAIVVDEGAYRAAGAAYWQGLSGLLREDLLSTHPDNAIAVAARTIGATLEQFFPVKTS